MFSQEDTFNLDNIEAFHKLGGSSLLLLEIFLVHFESIDLKCISQFNSWHLVLRVISLRIIRELYDDFALFFITELFFQRIERMLFMLQFWFYGNNDFLLTSVFDCLSSILLCCDPLLFLLDLSSSCLLDLFFFFSVINDY